MTLAQLIQITPVDGDPMGEAVWCQVTAAREASTKAGKPFLDLEIADGTAHEKFKVWQDSNAYDQCSDLQSGDFVRVEAQFRRNQFGLNVDRLSIRFLNDLEIAQLLAGSAERQAFLAGELAAVKELVAQVRDPRLRLVAQTFLELHAEKFSRAAAARDYHHARRGGLLEHVAQMMRGAEALSAVYPTVHWDLVKVGALLHDCGKLWENDYAADCFVMPITLVGELIGHITTGFEVVNGIWRNLAEHPEFKAPSSPPNDLVKQHLLHLIASHHGQLEFGSPVTPRTPEGWMLHYLDNLDAKYEMLRRAYIEKPEVAPGIYERRPPLDGRPVAPLLAYEEPV
jgi:3'-5' exoribonuclease